jgi:outer membrane lipoprotein-sorting protein
LHTDGNSATSYQRLGIEVVDGRNTNKYRVVVNESSAGSVSLSETLIWVDETLNMPIKSETVSADGTRVTMQLLEIVLEVDKSLFEIPENYEKVTFSELRKRRKSS